MQFLFQLGLVQPTLRSAADFVAVVEHEARAVRMAEVIKRSNLVSGSIFAVVKIVTKLVGRPKIDKLQVIGLAHRIDDTKQVLFLLSLSPFVSGAVNQPSHVRRRTILLTELSNPDSASSDKIHPPIVVRFDLVFFPRHEGRSAGDDDMFVIVLGERSGGCKTNSEQ